MSGPPGSAEIPEREESDEEHPFEKVVGVFSLDTQSSPLRTEKGAHFVIRCRAILLKSQRIIRFSGWSAFQCMLVENKGERAIENRTKRLEDK
jgi:hypothetical protein